MPLCLSCAARSGLSNVRTIKVEYEVVSGLEVSPLRNVHGGLAMGSFEWMELQTLTSDITAARSRLAAARSKKDHRVIRVLEEEIAAAEARRARLLAHITTHLAGNPEPAPDPETTEGADAYRAGEPVEEPPRDEGEADQPSRELVDPTLADGAASPAALEADSGEGDIIVWNQLTPGDIGRAKDELGMRRAEMLARHAEELNRLDGDQTQLDSLERAIDAFMRKFNSSSREGVPDGTREAAIVALGNERELRLQGRG
jgi:hypothetical protein